MLEQQREHPRNDEQMRHLIGFDRREKSLRIEPRVDHHASAAAPEEARPGIVRRMVERPRGVRAHCLGALPTALRVLDISIMRAHCPSHLRLKDNYERT